MAGTLVAVFEDHKEAETAARKLLDSGVAFGDISIVRKDAGGEVGNHTDQTQPDDDEEEFVSQGFREVPMHDVEQPLDPREERAPRAITGIVAGSPLGALVVATAAVIPGIGPVIMAGPLFAMMTGAVAGGVIGALVGAMTSGGIPVNDAQFYHDHVTHGDALLAVLTSSHDVDKLRSGLEESGGHDVKFFRRFIDSVQSVES